MRPFLTAAIVTLACLRSLADQSSTAAVETLLDGYPYVASGGDTLALAVEGWEPSKAPVAFAGETILEAGDPDEHGVRIRQGQLMSRPFPVEPFAFYRLRFLAQAVGKPLCAAVFLDKDGKEIVADDHDSIYNDTTNSLYETLLARNYPGAKLEIVTSVRGGTGCWYYKDEGRVKPYVLDYEPDLVMIAGISHGFDVEAIRSVIRQIREGSNCEIFVMSGAIAPREIYEPQFLKEQSPAAALDDMEQFPARMRRMCREERVEFFDIRKAWDDYMLRSYKPYDHFARDAIHGNSRGKQIVARILARYFEPKDAAQ